MRNLLKRMLLIILTISVLVPFCSFAAPEFTKLEQKDIHFHVRCLQKRLYDLGYYNYKLTNVFGSYTLNSLQAFEKHNGIKVSEEFDSTVATLLYSNDALFASPTATRQADPLPVEAKKITTYGEPVEWPQGLLLFMPGTNAVITDIESGIDFNVVRTGGTSFALVDTVSSIDAAAYETIAAFKIGWQKRPILLSVAGQTIAASMLFNSLDAKNEDYDTGKKNFQGIELFLKGSTSGIGSFTDIEHENNIKIAANIQE